MARSRYVRVLIAAIPVPIVILLVYLTRGGIEPHLSGAHDTWNIQYLLHFTAALAGAAMAYRWRERIGKTWFWAIVIWNAAWAILAAYATIVLWGEMY